MRIFPSQVTNFILETYPMDRALADLYPTMAPPEGLPQLKQMVVGPDERPRLAALLNLVAAIPHELLTFPPADQAHFLIATSTIQSTIQEWDQRKIDARLGPVRLLGNENPVHALYRLLKGCSDEAAAAATPDLQLIADPQLRASLRLDISSAHKALSNGEWKAATVLSGSIIEALLLWAIQTKPPADLKLSFEHAKQLHEAREKVDGNASPSFGRYDPSPSNWIFMQLIGVAEQAGLISKETAKAANLTRGYRNLIHSGAAIRKASVCGIDTAHSAIGALQATIRDLTKSIP